MTFEYTKTLNYSTEILGKQLYMILHDPNGDNSYSTFSEATTLSIGVGSEITTALGTSIEIGEDFELFGIEAGASLLLTTEVTVGTSFDFRFEVKDTTSLTSGQVEDDPDYIGPGFGDRYWGESWIYKWVLNASYKEYSNGTKRWENPKLFYGILRGVETFASDEHAPPEWRSQNAVYNNSIPVDWIGWFQGSGGAPYTYEHEVTTTTTRKTSFGIDLGADFESKFAGVESHITVELSMKNYGETGQNSVYKVAYEIRDDEPTDFLVIGRGIDRRFGTFIFNTSSFFCETSHPLEHGTYDYLPPEISFPDIDLDSDNDGYGPTDTDSPVVVVDIFEEGGIQVAFIYYSINNGIDWEISYLSELILDPGTWQGTIPAQSHNTNVLWYIQALDINGNEATRKDSYGNPFEYLVIQKPIGIPGWPPLLTISILMVSILALVVIFHRRHRKPKER